MNNIKEKIEQMRVSIFGLFFYYCLPYRKKVIHANIDQVFKSQIAKTEKKKLVQAFYSHLATSIKEALFLRFMTQDDLRSQVEVRGHERMLQVAAQGKGVLVLTGHFGNWEYAPIGGVLNFKQFQGQFHFIRKTLNNKFLERILFGRYFRAGLHVIPKKNSLDQVCAALENNHAVIFVLDQHASLANRDGIAVEFFGKKAGTYRSLASLARHTGVPVVPASGYRLPNGKHVLEFHEPIVWQEYATVQESLYRNTLAYNQALEKLILHNPEQWLWLHKRWKLKD